jgi:hypothetical protein
MHLDEALNLFIGSICILLEKTKCQDAQNIFVFLNKRHQTNEQTGPEHSELFFYFIVGIKHNYACTFSSFNSPCQ